MTRPPFGATVAGNRWDTAGPAAPDLRVSVVVCHYEQPRELARTLAALDRQTRRPDEVVVADDGSAVAPSVPDHVRLVRQADRGFRAAAARNLGVAATTGELVVLLDADTTPEPGCVAALVDLPTRLPECLVVGRRRHADLSAAGIDGPIEKLGPRHELQEPAWLRDGYAASRDLLDADHTGHRLVISAVLACTRWWWDEVGGFDATFSAYGGEDWDLAHRTWLAGGLLAHRPDAVAWHDGPDAGDRPHDEAARRAETTALADRVAAPGTGWRGLLRGPADVVVTCAPALGTTELLVTVDSLLAAVPTARVRLSAEHRAAVGADPRLLPLDAPLDAARLHLDLAHGAFGDAAAWQQTLGTLDGHGSRDVGVGDLVDLRLARRAHRWARPDVAPRHPRAASYLTAWESRHSLEAWLGGWAR